MNYHMVNFYPDGSCDIFNGVKSAEFRSREEFEKYTGVKAPDVYQLNYQPKTGTHHEFDGENTIVHPIPNEEYEYLIENIDTYVARQNDITYGLTPREVTKVLAERDLRNLTDVFRVESQAPVTVTVEEGTFTFNGGDDSASAIAGAIQRAELKSRAKVPIWDINNVIREYSYGSATAIALAISDVWEELAFAYQTEKVRLQAIIKENS